MIYSNNIIFETFHLIKKHKRKTLKMTEHESRWTPEIHYCKRLLFVAIMSHDNLMLIGFSPIAIALVWKGLLIFYGVNSPQ